MRVKDISGFRDKQRTKIKAVRRALKTDDWSQLSDKVFRRLICYEPLQQATVVHCYLSVESEREVDTRPVLSWLLGAGKRVCVPVVVGKQMVSVCYDDRMTMVAGKFGVPEPEKKTRVDESQIELVLVPLLAADRSGNRLGYGKGYYDRFFNRLALEEKIFPIKVGLAFDFQLVEEVPIFKTDNHEDVPLDAIVTEKNLIYIKRR